MVKRTRLARKGFAVEGKKSWPFFNEIGLHMGATV